MAIAAIVALVVVVLILAYLVLSRRRGGGEVPEVHEPPTGEIGAGETDTVEMEDQGPTEEAPDDEAELEGPEEPETDEKGPADLTEGVEEGPQV